MVAFTSPYNLPYPTGGDAPCDAPLTWCDFADLVDSTLIDFNDTVNRTTRAVPFAKVSTTVSQTLTANDALLFSTVEADTDGMVNLSQTPYSVTPQRNGIYRLEGYMSIIDNVFNRFWLMTIEENGGTFIASEDGSTRNFQSIVTRARAFVRITNAPNTSYNLALTGYGAAASDPVVIAGELSILWQADL